MYAPYTANDLVRAMEIEMEERHAASELRQRRLHPDFAPKRSRSRMTVSRFAAALLGLLAVM